MGIKDNAIVYMSGKTWQYSKGNRQTVILFVAMFVIANLIHALEPLIIALIVNTIQAEGITQSNLNYLLLLTSLVVARSIGFWIFHGPARVMELKNSFFVESQYKRFLLNGTLHLPLEWHADHHSGDTIDRINKASQALFEFSGEIFIIIENAVRFATAYAALVYFNLASSYIVLIFTAIAVAAIHLFDKTLRKRWRTLSRAENRISAKIFDVISNITTVIILRVEHLLSKEIFKSIIGPFGFFTKTQKINETKWFLVSTCAAGMMAGVIGTYITSSFHSGSAIMIGTIFALYQYVTRISDIFYELAWRYSNIVRNKTRVENGEEIALNFKKKGPAGRRLQGTWQKLQINKLSFSYQDKQEGELHLDHISFSIQHGQKIALIGESGSGKTTFLKLIRALYKPRHAEVMLDGKRVPQGLDGISEEVTLLPQEPELFNTTIRNNITMGVSHPDRMVKKFTDMAVFTKIVERLHKGLDTNILEKGVNLSGGEKQRLALARGLLAAYDKPILLLDEPTSSVDARTETQIYDNIFSSFADKSIISSIHRLHLLNRFDQIYMFDKGRIIAKGTLGDLKRTCPRFRELWKKYHQKKRL